MKMRQLLQRLGRDQSGATSVEYGLIATLIFVVIVTSVTLLGERTAALFDHVYTSISTAMDGGDKGGEGSNPPAD